MGNGGDLDARCGRGDAPKGKAGASGIQGVWPWKGRRGSWQEGVLQEERLGNMAEWGWGDGGGVAWRSHQDKCQGVSKPRWWITEGWG